MNATIYDLVHDLQLYNIDYISKVTDKALKIKFKVLMISLILIDKDVAAVLNKVCITLNKLSIIL